MQKGLFLSYLLLLLVCQVKVFASDNSKPLHKISPTDNTKNTHKETRINSTQATNKIHVYQSVKSDGTALFSDKKPLNTPYQLLRFDCFACSLNSSVNWHTVPLYVSEFKQYINQAAEDNQLDSALIRAVIHAESSFKSQAISKKGAVGLMQLMPETANYLGVKDAMQPSENIEAGSRYLAQLLKQYNQDVPLALAAYNAGSSNVQRYKGIPPFAETKAYIERVEILYKRYQRFI